MQKKRGHVIIPRRAADPLFPEERTNILGEAHLESFMALVGWRSARGLDMDNQKVDYIYRSGHAIIDVQLKSANLKSNGKSWSWNVIKSREKEIDRRFYNEPHTFLCLVGIKVRHDVGQFFQEEIKEGKLPKIALIPGKVVFKYFTETKPNKRSITLFKKKLEGGGYGLWNDYFGEKQMRKILTDSCKEQELEEAYLKRYRDKKNARSSKNKNP